MIVSHMCSGRMVAARNSGLPSLQGAGGVSIQEKTFSMPAGIIPDASSTFNTLRPRSLSVECAL